MLAILLALSIFPVVVRGRVGDDHACIDNKQCGPHGVCGTNMCMCDDGWCHDVDGQCTLPKSKNGLGECPQLQQVGCDAGLKFFDGYGCGGELLDEMILLCVCICYS